MKLQVLLNVISLYQSPHSSFATWHIAISGYTRNLHLWPNQTSPSPVFWDIIISCRTTHHTLGPYMTPTVVMHSSSPALTYKCNACCWRSKLSSSTLHGNVDTPQSSMLSSHLTIGLVIILHCKNHPQYISHLEHITGTLGWVMIHLIPNEDRLSSLM